MGRILFERSKACGNGVIDVVSAMTNPARIKLSPLLHLLSALIAIFGSRALRAAIGFHYLFDEPFNLIKFLADIGIFALVYVSVFVLLAWLVSKKSEH